MKTKQLFFTMVVASTIAFVGCTKQEVAKKTNEVEKVQSSDGLVSIEQGTGLKKFRKLSDLGCPYEGGNCADPPVVIKPKPELTALRIAADAGPLEVANYFNSSSWYQIFPYLTNTTLLLNLQSGTYDIVRATDNQGIEYYVTGLGTVTDTNFDFVLTLHEE